MVFMAISRVYKGDFEVIQTFMSFSDTNGYITFGIKKKTAGMQEGKGRKAKAGIGIEEKAEKNKE